MEPPTLPPCDRRQLQRTSSQASSPPPLSPPSPFILARHGIPPPLSARGAALHVDAGGTAVIPKSNMRLPPSHSAVCSLRRQPRPAEGFPHRARCLSCTAYWLERCCIRLSGSIVLRRRVMSAGPLRLQADPRGVPAPKGMQASRNGEAQARRREAIYTVRQTTLPYTTP